MAITKSKRFEIFARDAFTCQYCGRRPPEVILEVDHIQPVSKGGDDDDINLITSCYDCNRGKSAKVITEVAPRPDADLRALRALQEIAEAKQYLKTSKKLKAERRKVIASLTSLWIELVTGEYAPTEKQWNVWLARFSPGEIEHGIHIAGTKASAGSFGWDQQRVAEKAIKYASGVMYRTREQQGETIQ